MKRDEINISMSTLLKQNEIHVQRNVLFGTVFQILTMAIKS